MAACLHPPGRASGRIKIMAFIVCDDCSELLRFLPHAGFDYRPITKLIVDSRAEPNEPDPPYPPGGLNDEVSESI